MFRRSLNVATNVSEWMEAQSTSPVAHARGCEVDWDMRGEKSAVNSADMGNFSQP